MREENGNIILPPEVYIYMYLTYWNHIKQLMTCTHHGKYGIPDESFFLCISITVGIPDMYITIVMTRATLQLKGVGKKKLKI